MSPLRDFVLEEVAIRLEDESAVIHRSGWRTILNSIECQYDLSHHIAGQIPYFYRRPESIAADFQGRHNALEMVVDLATRVPTLRSFQRSHCGEILSALYLEEVHRLRRLYSKLTLTTSANTNVHKMDAFFVDTHVEPYLYVAVEAKTSILPTSATPFTGHRYGILKQLIASFENYGELDQRFDLTLIRDHLEEGFLAAESRTIRADLVPPGPRNLARIGIATINVSTVCVGDDRFILTEECKTPFTFRCLAVADLADLAERSFGRLNRLRELGDRDV